MAKKRNRKAFTIVELVIVIAVIAILATVLVPTFGNVINNAKDSAAKQEARNAYTEYVVDAAASGTMGQYYVYQADEGRFVAIDSGSAVGVYDTQIAALEAMVGTVDESKIFNTGDGKLFTYGAEPVPGGDGEPDPDEPGTPNDPDTPDEPSIDSFMHISFDDVQLCFNNLKENNYSSLYDEPFFGWLKGLHDAYDAKFSLYIYGGKLDGVPDTYAAEFAAASDWLKIGLHSPNGDNDFGSKTYDYGKSQWNAFVTAVKNVTGTTDSVDRVPRLHTFAGSEAALQGMHDADCGAMGFLSADDSRVSYYLTQEITNYLYDNDHITDHKNGLVFLSTDLRGDWFKESFTISNQYKAPIKKTVYEELDYRYSDESFTASLQSYIFFTHEWEVYTGSTFDADKQWVEDACKFAFDRQIAFKYPQNVTLSATDYDIYSSESGGDDDDNVTVEPSNTTTRNGATVTIVNDITEMQYAGGWTFGNGGVTAKAVTGRAASLYYILRVSGGEIISLAQTTVGGKALTYALTEFTDIPLTIGNMTGSGQKWGGWLTNSTTLQVDTKYVMIGFKNGDGSTDFTADELTQLSSCLTITEEK